MQFVCKTVCQFTPDLDSTPMWLGEGVELELIQWLAALSVVVPCWLSQAHTGAYHNHTGNNLPVARCYFTHGCGLWWEKYVTISINNYEQWDSLPVLEVGLKWLHKAGECGERLMSWQHLSAAHNCTMIYSVSTSRRPARMWASRLSTDALVFYAFPIWWVFICWSEWYSSPYWQWQLWRIADLFWQTHCLKMETRTVTPDGKQWVRGRRRLKEWQECNNHKKAKRWQDKNRDM